MEERERGYPFPGNQGLVVSSVESAPGKLVWIIKNAPTVPDIAVRTNVSDSLLYFP